MHYIDKDIRGHLSIHALHKPEWGAASELCPQQGIVTYRLAPNRVNPMAGALHAAVFNVWRRTRQQILYWGTPMLLGYLTLQWAEERYVIRRKENRMITDMLNSVAAQNRQSEARSGTMQI